MNECPGAVDSLWLEVRPKCRKAEGEKRARAIASFLSNKFKSKTDNS